MSKRYITNKVIKVRYPFRNFELLFSAFAMSQNNKAVTRSGSASSLSAIGSSAKRSRDDLSKQSDDGEIGSLDELWNKMQSMLTNTIERIEAKIDSCNAVLEKRISSIEDQLVAVREECSEKVRQLEDTVASVRMEVDHSIESVYRMDKNKDLIFSGVPYQSQEDLKSIFQKIAVSIGYDLHCVPLVDLQRLARAPIGSGMTPPVLCEFALRGSRNEFYRKYLSKRSLCLRDIGFESGNRIYINENLTANAREIRAAAIKLKKLGEVQHVSTRNGIVFIKPKGSENSKAIHTVKQIASHIKTPILK